MTAQTQPEALRRVQAYIARLKQSQRIDRECISVFDSGAPSEVSLLTSDIEWMPSRIAELEAKASENYWLLYAMKEQELWYQDELVEEAKRTAAEKLRADQMTEQHRMQSAMNTEARGELAQLREKRQAARIAQLEAALAGAEPASGQCRFAGEKSWGWCAVEHVRMVQADPRYAAEGYEARYLYTHPPASRQPQSDEQIDDLLGEANRGYDIEREHYFKAFRDAEAAHNITGGPA